MNRMHLQLGEVFSVRVAGSCLDKSQRRIFKVRKWRNWQTHQT